MALSPDLISAFVKATNDKSDIRPESTVSGTVVMMDDRVYVRIDGSTELTPVTSLVGVNNNDRVQVSISNHKAVITGNMSSPSASGSQTVSASDIAALRASIADLQANSATINELNTTNAKIADLEADLVTISCELVSQSATINSLNTNKLDADVASITYATITQLDATNASIHNLSSTYANFEVTTTNKLIAVQAFIDNLDIDGTLTVESLEGKFATIDFANINQAAIEKMFAGYGLIEELVISEGSVTGFLAGVTIKGDLIEAETIVADKLVVQGDDGLYYKLNTDGIGVEADQTEYNSLNGSVITAKSITATKIDVDDLVAFDATIGGFNITDSSIYSGVKESIDNPTIGIYMDKYGQIAFGDDNNYLRYYKDLDEDGNEIYKLEISAESILFGGTSKSSASDLKALTEHVKISTYVDAETTETEPCVELSEGDSDFKQVITNTKTMFMDGSAVRTEINTDGVKTENVIVKKELRHGGYVWSIRSNGNYCLSWKGVTQ
jgi:hypothetical protein